MLNQIRLKISNSIEWNINNINIARASVLIGLLTIIVKLCAAVKEAVIAYMFGSSSTMDCYFLAFMILTTFTMILISSFNSGIIPTYLKVLHKDGPTISQNLFNQMTCWGMVAFFTIMLLFAIFSNPLITLLAPGFSPEKISYTVHIFQMMLPMMLFNGISCIWGSMLNAHRRFSVYAISPISTPLSIILLLLFNGGAWSVNSLIAANIFGSGIEMLMLGFVLIRCNIMKFKISFKLDTNSINVIKQVIPIAISALISSGITMTDFSMASLIHTGDVSAMSYANKLIAFPLTIAVTALGGAIVPYVSSLNSNSKWRDIKVIYNHSLSLIFLIGIPTSLLLLFLAPDITRLVYERGMFTTGDTAIVTLVFRMFVLQIPFYVAGFIGTKILSSLCRNHIIMYSALFNLVFNLILNLILMHYLGIAGIALSTSIVYVISCCYIYIIIKHVLKKTSAQQSLE